MDSETSITQRYAHDCISIISQRLIIYEGVLQSPWSNQEGILKNIIFGHILRIRSGRELFSIPLYMFHFKN